MQFFGGKKLSVTILMGRVGRIWHFVFGNTNASAASTRILGWRLCASSVCSAEPEQPSSIVSLEVLDDALEKAIIFAQVARSRM